jgi:uncharacterized protein
MKISHQIAAVLGVRPAQVEAAVKLLDEGASVPFVARYRKEVTGGLDDTQLRTLEERLTYLRELEDRRATILKSIEEQEKLTPDLKEAILAADTKTRLEDLYLPFKPKRRSKAQIAREAGIEPLLDRLLEDPLQKPEPLAQNYLNPETGFTDSKAVLEGARQIFMERVAEQADLVGELRETVWQHGLLTATVIEGQQENGAKFSDYFSFSEALQKIPSHRALALFRGRTEGVLRLKLHVPGQDDLQDPQQLGRCEAAIAHYFGIADQGRVGDGWLMESVHWAWRAKVSIHIETELNMRLREQAEEEAIRVFGENLKDLLLAAPAGPRVTMGLDPGLRTGVKVVVIDDTGKLVAHTTIYPHAPKNQWAASMATLADLVQRHGVTLVSIGNGTASRETDKLVKELIKTYPKLGLTSVVVSEAGASVYSASEFAAKEFPELDVSLRGAVSIARRLQDPLAELVKIEPKAIGVGQYQHDVNQLRLSRKLDAVVEDCVNAVGVVVNTASVPLLTQVAGLNETVASNIVHYRQEHGRFQNRTQLKKVPRLGPKAFEQAAGFLRIVDGDNPLDASAVHPEAYPVVERILRESKRSIVNIIGDTAFLQSLVPTDFTDERFGEPTVKDILGELEKPGRDPRPALKTALFKEGIESIGDLKPGLTLEGVVTNVTNFGAFVDIGVHQDGLVHISALANTFVKDPRTIVKTGDVVKVKVLSVDEKRRRVGLSMRLHDETEVKINSSSVSEKRSKQSSKPSPRNDKASKKPAPSTAMAEAFARLKR